MPYPLFEEMLPIAVQRTFPPTALCFRLICNNLSLLSKQLTMECNSETSFLSYFHSVQRFAWENGISKTAESQKAGTLSVGVQNYGCQM